jgi:hypothetical protein
MTESKPLSAELSTLLTDIRALGDELRLQLHLASAEAKTAWAEDLEPRLARVEAGANEAGHAVLEAATALAGDLRTAITNLRDRLQ